jgi:hypothetical protein
VAAKSKNEVAPEDMEDKVHAMVGFLQASPNHLIKEEREDVSALAFS